MTKKMRSRNPSKSRSGKVRRKVTRRRPKSCKRSLHKTRNRHRRTRRKKHIGGSPSKLGAWGDEWVTEPVSADQARAWELAGERAAQRLAAAEKVDQFACTPRDPELSHPYRLPFTEPLMGAGAAEQASRDKAVREVEKAMQSHLDDSQMAELREFLKSVFWKPLDPAVVKKRSDIEDLLAGALLDLDTLVAEPKGSYLKNIKKGPRIKIIHALKKLQAERDGAGTSDKAVTFDCW